ncbi:hypothetical protein [Streptosporangium vulgare]|uniref:Uncharacterized protein n=1 Tax=Streptosporangium vulgare TaxID=46190 RepID=A0ABV5TJ37_9ACTN
MTDSQSVKGADTVGRDSRGHDANKKKTAIDHAITGVLDAHARLYEFGVSLERSIADDPVFKQIADPVAGKLGPKFTDPAEIAEIGAQRLKLESILENQIEHVLVIDELIADSPPRLRAPFAVCL